MQTTTGYPRILYDGYSFGRRKVKNEPHGHQYWICTGTSENKKRCGAALTTKVIDGLVMMRVKKKTSIHICLPKKQTEYD